MIRVKHPTRKGAAFDGALLDVDDVRVRYGGIEALKVVSLTVARGEIVALLGANGAGKTTTLKSIARLLPLASGRVQFGGRDTSSSSTTCRS